MRKILLTAFVAVILLGAAPALAQIAGVWEGVGSGAAYPPNHPKIYPWQSWSGEIPDSEDYFKGEWADGEGNYGTFEGKLVPSPIPEERRFEGIWTWIDPSSVSKKSGDFVMIFYISSKECHGTWTAIWPSPGLPGTMKGWKVN